MLEQRKEAGQECAADGGGRLGIKGGEKKKQMWGWAGWGGYYYLFFVSEGGVQ